MAYAEVFGGNLLFPSQLSYLKLTTAVDLVLQWPTEQQVGGISVVADFLDINATAPSLNVDMPSASQSSTGNKTTINNVGSNTFTVRDSTGGTIQSVAPGEQWVIVLTDNTTAAGTWSTFQLGASVSVASASALAGAGIKAIATTLNQQIDSDVEGGTPFTVVDGDRAKCLIYTAGAGTCNLPSPGTVGNDWFFMLRNSGTGTLNVLPPSGVIDGAASINLDPGVSTFVFTDGTDFFTVGLSTGSLIAFDFVSIAIPGSGDFVLSGANLNRISYRFTGALTGNRKIVVPNTTQQYWVDNQTSGAFSLTVGTAAGASPAVPQGQSAIFYSDATDVVNAVSSTSVAFPITVGQGGTGATTIGGAQVNLQVPPTSRDMIAGAGLSGGGDLSADRTFAVLQATEGALGGAEIATQGETDTGTDDTRMVTPLKLANSARIQGKVKAADTPRNTTTTLTDDPDLAGFGLQPSSEYIVECVLSWGGNGATANGFRWAFDFNGEVGNVSVFGGLSFSFQASSLAESIIPPSGAASQVKATFDDAGVREKVYIRLSVITGAGYTPGTAIDLQWAQGTSNGTDTDLEGGSSMVVTKIS